MQPDLKREGLRWWRQAESDLGDARYTFAGERYNLTCFLAQQSAEKALKAYLYCQGVELVPGHSVRELAEMAAEFDAEFATLGKEVAPLDQYYIQTCYPNGSPGGVPFEAFNEDDGQRGLKLAQRVLEAVRARLHG